MTEFTIFTLLN